MATLSIVAFGAHQLIEAGIQSHEIWICGDAAFASLEASRSGDLLQAVACITVKDAKRPIV